MAGSAGSADVTARPNTAQRLFFCPSGRKFILLLSGYEKGRNLGSGVEGGPGEIASVLNSRIWLSTNLPPIRLACDTLHERDGRLWVRVGVKYRHDPELRWTGR
jgi:hypothetical protein